MEPKSRVSVVADALDCLAPHRTRHVNFARATRIARYANFLASQDYAGTLFASAIRPTNDPYPRTWIVLKHAKGRTEVHTLHATEEGARLTASGRNAAHAAGKPDAPVYTVESRRVTF